MNAVEEDEKTDYGNTSSASSKNLIESDDDAGI